MPTRPTLALAAALCALSGLPAPGAPTWAPVQPQGQDLPKAEDLFEGYIAAVGGMENINKHRNRVLHGIYRVAANGDTQILTLYCEAPDRMRAELDAPAIGSTVRATNGELAWGTNSSGTPFRLSAPEAAELQDNAIFIGEAGYKDRYESVRTVGVASFDDRPTYQVEYVSKTGLTGSIYFDAETKLVVGRQVQKAANEPGTLVLVKDYKEFEGVKLPTLQQQRFQNVETPGVEIEFRWVEVNVDDLPTFDPPAALAPDQPSGG